MSMEPSSSVDFSNAIKRCILWRVDGKAAEETRRIKKKKIQKTPTILRLRSGTTKENPLPKTKLGRNPLHTKLILQLIRKVKRIRKRHGTTTSKYRRKHRTTWKPSFPWARRSMENNPGDPMKDPNVNLATWWMFMNTTFQAAVHLGRKYAKSHIWDNNLKKNTRNRWFEINWTRRHYMEIDRLIVRTCTHTHLSHAHFFCARRAHCVLRTSSCVSHRRMAQVSRKRCLLHIGHTSPSRLLHSHVSPVLAVPWRSLRDHSRQRLHWRPHPHDLAVLSRPASAGHAPLRTCITKVWLPGQVRCKHK